MYQQTQSQALRMKIRNNIRDQHIRYILSEQRKKFMSAEREDHIQNNLKGNNGNSDSFFKNKCANKEMGKSIIWQVQSILFDKKSVQSMESIGGSQFSEGEGDKKIVREDQLHRVWKMIINSKEECLSETSILLLINGAIQDINQIIWMSQFKERWNEECRKELCQRICIFIWVFSSEIFQNQSISEKILVKLAHICLTIINHEFRCNKNKGSYVWDQTQHRYRYETISEKFLFTQFDEYIIGFCVIVLVNICKNVHIIKQILKEDKLSDLIQKLNIMLDKNNLQDLILLVTNILCYYPKFQFEPSMAEQKEQSAERNNINYIKIMLRYEQEKLELSFVSEYLCQKIRENLLFYFSNLNRGESQSFQSPHAKKYHPNSKSHKKCQQVQKNSKNLPENRRILNQSEQKQVKELLKNNQQRDQSEYSETDLIQCVKKIEQMLFQMKYNKQNMRQPTNIVAFDESKEVDKIRELTSKIKKIESSIYEIQQDIANLSFRILTLKYKINQKILDGKSKKQLIKNHLLIKESERIKQMVTFVSRLMRSIHWKDIKEKGMKKNNLQKQNWRILGERMEQRLVRNVLDQIHDFITSYNMSWDTTNQQQINEYENSLMEMNDSLWEIYEYLMNLAQYKVSNLNGSEEQGEWKNLIGKQLDWLEMKLFTNVNGTSGEELALCQQKYIISLLIKFYPFIRVNYKQIQSPLAYEQHVEIQMQKLRKITQLLHCKLIEHKQCDGLILSIVQSINYIVKSIKAAFRGQAQISVMNSQTGKLEISEILGQQLRHQLKDIAFYYQTTYYSLSMYICETIDEIFEVKPELMQQEQLGQQRMTEQM